ncbi:MAG: hypothetical protein Q7S65_06175 [Nanoarchaeota archaeon]|nr:hypothetical protein [Nanoarchaeota archaeon]
MGKRKYLNRIEQLFEKSPVVSFDSIERIVQSKKKNSYAKVLVSNLVRQGKIKKLVKGCYTIHPDAGLAVFCFPPAYLGLQSALSLHRIWDQETVPVILTAKNVRMGMRQVLGSNVLVRKIAKKHYFGQELHHESRFYLPYSDLEKTLIDFVSFRERLSPEALKELRKKIDRKKLERYLAKYPAETGRRVRGLVKSG